MSRMTPTVIDISTGASIDDRPPPPIADRVLRKKDILQEWITNGIPKDRSDCPRSLNQARLWDDPQSGIYAIRSPNEFTTGHPQWGEDVKKIGECIRTLTRRYARPKKREVRQATAQIGVTKITSGRESHLVAQWHAEREAHALCRARIVSAELTAKMCLQDIAARDAQINELHRRLAFGGTPKSVK
jgi:hypothetical protein